MARISSLVQLLRGAAACTASCSTDEAGADAGASGAGVELAVPGRTVPYVRRATAQVVAVVVRGSSRRRERIVDMIVSVIWQMWVQVER